MIFIMIPTIILTSLLFTQLSHPLSMGLMLLFQTILVCLLSGLTSNSFWFSYILFLIFLGGMLVLFIYVASIASNENFKFSMLTFFLVIMLISFMSLILLMIDPLSSPNLISIPPSSIFTPYELSYPNLINWLYSPPSMMFTLFIILYLLLTLFVVVKVTNLFMGPMRLSL
uniref:NADH-ubiquinone oxidoreductase chain 6 n=1 Tax=Dynomene pilumnoides TaxID=1702342 RepID=A0A1B0RXM5_9EUCA|nr:NADH dehydrogenase subunit 6 [Dynomene pilumnoides]